MRPSVIERRIRGDCAAQQLAHARERIFARGGTLARLQPERRREPVVARRGAFPVFFAQLPDDDGALGEPLALRGVLLPSDPECLRADCSCVCVDAFRVCARRLQIEILRGGSLSRLRTVFPRRIRVGEQSVRLGPRHRGDCLDPR